MFVYFVNATGHGNKDFLYLYLSVSGYWNFSVFCIIEIYDYNKIYRAIDLQIGIARMAVLENI